MLISSGPFHVRIFRFLCTISLAALGPIAVFAQQPKVLAPHKPVDPRDPISKTRLEPAVERSMIGGFWTTDANRKASIYIKNGLETASITVEPVFFLSNGARYELDSITLGPAATSVISINNSLEKLGIAPWGTLTGYVELNYSWPWDPLCATVTSLDAVHSLVFTTGFQPSIVTDLPIRGPKVRNGLNIIEGLWWKPTVNATVFVALSNSSTQPTEAKIRVSNATNSQIDAQEVHLSAHATKIVRLAQLQPLPAGATGGLEVEYTGAGTTMLINGGVEDDDSGYSANLPFHFVANPEPSEPTDETYAELGLMNGEADPMMSFPVGTTFKPFSVVRNVADAPVTIVPSFYWMEGGAPHSARLSSLVVTPLSSVALDVPALLTVAGLGRFRGNVNLILEAQGPSQSLLLASGSVDAKNSYVFQVLPRGIQNSTAKSISYWSTANGDNTMVTIWNPADESQDFIFTLFYESGHYRLPIHLEARETRNFNISEIIVNQLPDDEGNTIPVAVREGSAKLTGSQADNEEILVAVDVGTYNVRKATCSYYCISCDGTVHQYVDYGSISPFAVGITSQFNLHETWNTGWTTYTSSGAWSSNHTNIATVGSTNGQGHGVSPGGTTFTASSNGPVYNSYYCNYNAYCPYYGPISGTGNQTVTPVINTINPTWGKVGTIVPVTISGNGFGTTPTVGFTGTGISVTYGTPRNNTTITAVFTIASNAPIGPIGVTVTNNTVGDGSSPTSSPIYFQIAPTNPVPVNFHQVNASDSGNGNLHFTYSWDSSTGNLADLSACTLGELVNYPGSSGSYSWPPPFPANSSNNPTIAEGTAMAGYGVDDHGLAPAYTFIKPYIDQSFTASQYYRYKCTNVNSGNYVNLVGPLPIQRSVKPNGNGTWRFTVTKPTNGLATINPLP